MEASHPQFVHLPLALAVVMPILAGSLLLASWRGWLPRRTWAILIGAQALSLVSGIIALRTGEADEDAVERWVPKAALEAHEQAGTLLVWGSGIVLALSLLPVLLRHAQAARTAALATAAGTVVVLILALRAGAAGGELVYRHGAAAAFTTSAGPGPAAPVAPPRDDEDHRR